MPVEDADGEWHRAAAVEANNSTWELLDRVDRTPDEVDDLLGRAYASTYHWRRAARRGPENQARGSWLVSHVHAVLGHGELALYHAERCAVVVERLACRTSTSPTPTRPAPAPSPASVASTRPRAELAAAHAVPIADDEDRKILEGDLAAGPWYGLTAEPDIGGYGT